MSLAHAYKEELLDNTAEENCEILHRLCFARGTRSRRGTRDDGTLNAIFHLAQLGIKHVSRLRPARTVEAEADGSADASADEDAEEIKQSITRAARQHGAKGSGIEGLFAVKAAVQEHFGVESFADLGHGDFVDFVRQHCLHVFATVPATDAGLPGREGSGTSREKGGTVSTIGEDRLADLIENIASPLDQTKPIQTLSQVEEDVTHQCDGASSFESLGHGSFLSFVTQRPRLQAKFRSGDRLVDVLGNSADKNSVLGLLRETAHRSSDKSKLQQQFIAAVQLQYGACSVGDLADKFLQQYLETGRNCEVEAFNTRMLFTEASFVQSRLRSACASKTQKEAIQAISTCMPLESIADETQVVWGVGAGLESVRFKIYIYIYIYKHTCNSENIACFFFFFDACMCL